MSEAKRQLEVSFSLFFQEECSGRTWRFDVKRFQRCLGVVIAALMTISILGIVPGLLPKASASSSPSGAQWTQYTFPQYTQIDFNAVYALDDTHVYAVGHDYVANKGVVYFFDGTKWSEMESVFFSSSAVKCVYAADANNVWVTNNNRICHYNGSYWSVQATMPNDHFFDDISGTGKTNIWAAGDSGLAHFNGSSWIDDSMVPVGSWRGVDAYSPNCVWATGQAGTYRYNGSTWTEILNTGSTFGGWRICGFGSNTAFIGINWLYRYSSDKWTTWTGDNGFEAIDGIDANHVWATDGGYIEFINGSSCQVDLVNKSHSFTDVFVKDAQHIWAVGAGNLLYKGTIPPKPTSWYLAEGTSDWGFETYVTIENPNASACTAQVSYMTKSGLKTRPDITLPAQSQTVINPRNDLGSTDFSTKVTCKEGRPIYVDRRMMWTGGSGAQVGQEGHSSVGVTAPDRTWYLAEGSSKWGFECWLLIQNPNASAASCQVTYMIDGAAPKTVTKTVPANSRQSYNIADDIGQADASIKVVGSLPVIPERAMYRYNRREGHDSIGTTSPAKTYYLAEGTTNWGFTTYVLVQNPNAQANNVIVTYMAMDGTTDDALISMEPNSRKTICVNDSFPGKDFSTQVTGRLPIIAERAMYWNNGTGEACHDSIGMPSGHTAFYLPDGETTNAHETWTLVQNPNAKDVNISITYMTSDGKGNKTLTDVVKAKSRKSYSLADVFPQGRASILVKCNTAGQKIMVERAMYWNNRGAGTDTIGGYSD
jgi:hypothetical protein